MPLRHRTTLTQYLIEERRRFPGSKGDFNALILDVALLRMKVGIFKFKARALVGDDLAVEAELTCAMRTVA